MRDLLVVGEVALSVLLTIGAGLLVNPGFQASRIYTAIIVLPGSRYPDLASDIAFYRKLLDRVHEIPGVESAGAVNGVPLSGNISVAFVDVEGHPSASSGANRLSAELFAATPDYLPTMGIALSAGRELTPQDAASGLFPAVINDLAAQRFWPGESPLGKRISVNHDHGSTVWRQVVGVVKTTHDQALDLAAEPAIHIPMEQAGTASVSGCANQSAGIGD